MKSYRLTKEAEKDLREVARYTRKEWGQAMLQEYRGGLKKTFEAIGNHDVVSRDFSLLLDRSVTFESLRKLALRAEKKTVETGESI